MQIEHILICRRVLRRLICVCTLCLCYLFGRPGINGYNVTSIGTEINLQNKLLPSVKSLKLFSLVFQRIRYFTRDRVKPTKEATTYLLKV